VEKLRLEISGVVSLAQCKSYEQSLGQRVSLTQANATKWHMLAAQCWHNQQELSKPRLATPLHACVLVTYLLSYQRYGQTDRQTDGRHTTASPLHC